jgi:signal peptidase I
MQNMADRPYRRVAHDLIRAGSSGGSLRLCVISDSMKPLICAGDVVIVQPIEPAALRRGDMVVIQSGDELITHRLVAASAAGYYVRGDNAAYTDAVAAADQIVGRVIAVERDGQSIDVRSRRWTRANRMLGRLGQIHSALYHWGQSVTSSAANTPRRRWRSVGAQLLALPFRWVMRSIIYLMMRWSRS